MISYKELIDNKTDNIITYQDLLSTAEWEDKRNYIINRDGHRCTVCSYSATGSFAHYDEKTKQYSYLTNDGSEELTYVKNEKGDIIEAYVPNIIVTYKSYHLQVHHKYYIINRLPWEYLDSALITLCNWCHSDLHINEIIKIYESDDLNNSNALVPCNRCNGIGWFEEYGHVKGGVCFKCNGQRFTTSLINKVEH